MNLCQYCSELVYDCISYVFCLPDKEYRYESIEKLSRNYDEITVFDSKSPSRSPDDFCLINSDMES